MEITKGTHITARHIQAGSLLHYRVVEEVESGLLRLLNLNSFNLMCGFKTKDPNKIVDYIKSMKCEIIKLSM